MKRWRATDASGRYRWSGVALVTALAVASSAPGASAQSGSPNRFDGVHITIAGPAGQIETTKTWADQWAAETGATVDIVAIAFADYDPRVLASTGTGTPLADLMSIGTGLAGQLMSQGSLVEVPAELQTGLDLESIAPLYQDSQLSWGDKMFALPWDCDVLNLYYRKDLLADPASQSAFEAQFGRPLAPPANWAEYADIASFFTNNPSYDGYGLVELPKKQNHAWNGFLSRAASYAKAPDDPAFFFDPDTMAPRINNPGFVKALEDWHTAIAFGPPDMLNYGWAENMQTFVSGRAALDVQWGDIGPISHDPDQSLVSGKLGYGVLPGSDQYYDASAGAWVTPDAPNVAPFAGYGGWIWVVPTLSTQQEAALDLAAYLAQPDIMAEASVTPGTGVNPCRTSLLDDQEFWVSHGFGPEEAAEYTGAIKASMAHPNAVGDLRIPGFPDYKDALETAITNVLSGQATAQAALDEAAAAWEQITDRLGRDAQKTAYRASIGLD